MSPRPERMQDHWRPRPGWNPGRRLYAWHVTFGNASEVRKLTGDCQDRMAGLPGLDLIPHEWLHLTVQGIGFTDEIPAADLEALASASRDRLAALEPVTVTLGPVFVHDEAVVLPAQPATALTPIRDHLREAAALVLGPARVRDGDGWIPHVSVAYSTGAGQAGPIIDALRPRHPARAVTVRELTLISQERAGHCYRWETVATLPLGNGGLVSPRRSS